MVNCKLRLHGLLTAVACLTSVVNGVNEKSGFIVLKPSLQLFSVSRLVNTIKHCWRNQIRCVAVTTLQFHSLGLVLTVLEPDDGESCSF